MATFKSLEDLAALQKEMKQKKQAKAKQVRSERDDNYAFVYSTTTYNSIDKNVLKKLKEAQTTNASNASHNKSAFVPKQDKKAREKLRRKLERKGLSKNAIKSQFRPRLTYSDVVNQKADAEHKATPNTCFKNAEERKPMIVVPDKRIEQKVSVLATGLRKAKVCKLCGKRISGDILEHFSEKHFSFYVANKETIMSHPGAFCVDEDKYDSKIYQARHIEVIKPKQHQTHSSKQTSETKPKKQHTFNHRKMREIISDLEERPQEQTYRGWKLFVCDGCDRICKHGKVIFVNRTKKLHICYDCYKYAKSIVQFKRGNKHFYINTPM